MTKSFVLAVSFLFILAAFVYVVRLAADTAPESFAATADYECKMVFCDDPGGFGPIGGECAIDANGVATGTCFHCDAANQQWLVCVKKEDETCTSGSLRQLCGAKRPGMCIVDPASGLPKCMQMQQVQGNCQTIKCQ